MSFSKSENLPVLPICCRIVSLCAYYVDIISVNGKQDNEYNEPCKKYGWIFNEFSACRKSPIHSHALTMLSVCCYYAFSIQ
jgi:hypothetical protein